MTSCSFCGDAPVDAHCLQRGSRGVAICAGCVTALNAKVLRWEVEAFDRAHATWQPLDFEGQELSWRAHASVRDGESGMSIEIRRANEDEALARTHFVPRFRLKDATISPALLASVAQALHCPRIEMLDEVRICDKTEDQADKLFAGALRAAICDDCVRELFATRVQASANDVADWTALAPRRPDLEWRTDFVVVTKPTRRIEIRRCDSNERWVIALKPGESASEEAALRHVATIPALEQ